MCPAGANVAEMPSVTWKASPNGTGRNDGSRRSTSRVSYSGTGGS